MHLSSSPRAPFGNGAANSTTSDHRALPTARGRAGRPHLLATILALLTGLGSQPALADTDVIWAPFEIKAIEFPPGYDPEFLDFNTLSPGATPPVGFGGGLPYISGEFSSPGGLWTVSPFADPQDHALSVATDTDPLELRFASGNVGALVIDRLCLTDLGGALVAGELSITVVLANGATASQTWITSAANPVTAGGVLTLEAPLVSATLTTTEPDRFVTADDVRVCAVPEPRQFALALALALAGFVALHRRWASPFRALNRNVGVRRSVLAMPLGLALAAWQSASAGAPAIPIDTHAYWPLDAGMVWTYRNAKEPHHLTRIEVRRVSERGVGLWFTKNHVATYWAKGSPQNLMFFLTRDQGYLYASNPRDFEPRWCSAFNDWPDDQRFDRETGLLVCNYWYLRCADDGIPPYVILPESLTVPSTLQFGQSYAGEDYSYEDGREVRSEQHISQASWKAEYTTCRMRQYPGAPVIRARFEESWTDVDGGSRSWNFEDWYFAKDIGPVRIEQFSDRRRRERDLVVRIMLWRMAPELMLSIDPDYLRLPEEDQVQPREFRFHVTLLAPGDSVRNSTVYWLDTSRPQGDQRVDLRQLFPEAYWQGTTFVVPTELTAADEAGRREFEVEDNHGNIARASLTLRYAAPAPEP